MTKMNGSAGDRARGDLVLITGGAGFIGSHLTEELIGHGHRVRILDNLNPQAHGGRRTPPEDLNPEAEFILGDACDPEAVRRALAGVDAVFHLAAEVGVGQSMYQIRNYTQANNLGTATLLDALAERAVALNPPRRLIIASSMSIYGEGLYRTRDGEPVEDAERTVADLKAGRWEPLDAVGRPLIPAPTPETKRPRLTSIYALSKHDQERMCLMIGQAYNIPTVALRFFNVFGPGQALSNPYTGVLAIFASRLLNNRAPLIYEDGAQMRDFVSVRDVARACRLALERPGVQGEVFNIGGGRSRTILEVAGLMAESLGKPHIEPEITGKCRIGDIRHCCADIAKARRELGYEPAIPLEEGVIELAGWVERQRAEDLLDKANHELDARGLTV